LIRLPLFVVQKGGGVEPEVWYLNLVRGGRLGGGVLKGARFSPSGKRRRLLRSGTGGRHAAERPMPGRNSASENAVQVR